MARSSSSSLRAAFAYAANILSQFQHQRPLLGSHHDYVGSSGGEEGSGVSTSTPITVAGGITITPYEPLSGAPSCPVDGPVSCHNKTVADSCCFVYPGGRLLLTQFWDEELHVKGGEEDWTVHGLWPDLCDGTYDQYCGMAPRFNNITAVLEHYDQSDMVEFMNRYWVAKYGTNDHLWAHEYNKHGTCINTLSPTCYGDDYSAGMEVVDYFTRAFGLFTMLDTYRALEAAGIEPSHHEKYSLAKIQATLEKFSGGKVILKCSHRDILHEAWYVYFVKGSLQGGEFVPARDSFKGDDGNCADEVRYLPKRTKR